MAAVAKLSLSCVFSDDSTTTITIDNINPEIGVNPNLRTIISNFNKAKGGELATKMKNKNGFNWIGIKRAVLTTTDRQYIF